MDGQMGIRMGEQIGRRIDGWTYGRKDAWMDRRAEGRMGDEMDRRVDGWTDGRKEGKMGEETGRRTDGWTEGRKNEQIGSTFWTQGMSCCILMCCFSAVSISLLNLLILSGILSIRSSSCKRNGIIIDSTALCV